MPPVALMSGLPLKIRWIDARACARAMIGCCAWALATPQILLQEIFRRRVHLSQEGAQDHEDIRSPDVVPVHVDQRQAPGALALHHWDALVQAACHGPHAPLRGVHNLHESPQSAPVGVSGHCEGSKPVHRHQEPGALSVRHRDVLTQAACRCSHSPLQRCMACARFHTSEQWVAWRYAGSKCPLSGDLAFPVLLRLCNMQMLHSSTFKYLDAYCT